MTYLSRHRERQAIIVVKHSQTSEVTTVLWHGVSNCRKRSVKLLTFLGYLVRAVPSWHVRLAHQVLPCAVATSFLTERWVHDALQ